jgi:hypothetical protein
MRSTDTHTLHTLGTKVSAYVYVGVRLRTHVQEKRRLYVCR